MRSHLVSLLSFVGSANRLGPQAREKANNRTRNRKECRPRRISNLSRERWTTPVRWILFSRAKPESQKSLNFWSRQRSLSVLLCLNFFVDSKRVNSSPCKQTEPSQKHRRYDEPRLLLCKRPARKERNWLFNNLKGASSAWWILSSRLQASLKLNFPGSRSTRSQAGEFLKEVVKSSALRSSSFAVSARGFVDQKRSLRFQRD